MNECDYVGLTKGAIYGDYFMYFFKTAAILLRMLCAVVISFRLRQNNRKAGCKYNNICSSICK